MPDFLPLYFYSIIFFSVFQVFCAGNYNYNVCALGKKEERTPCRVLGI